MSLESEVAGLTVATTDLLAAVNTKKQVLDTAAAQAKASEDAARSSQTAAASSATSASGSASTATTKASEAASSASSALASKNAAATSEANALASKNAAASSATSASGSATTATTKAAEAAASAVSAATAVADAALPFPDVWIPFNDSLRMLAGYGDDIKVGDYTVATQASFSRASTATYIDKSGVLMTAAINEPRFEKEGLLIEGQSTNLVPWSNCYNADTASWATYNYTLTKLAEGVRITPAVGVLEKSVRTSPDNIFPDQASRPITITIEAKPDGYDMIVLGFRATYISTADNGIGVSLIDGSVKKTNQGLAVTKFEKLADGFVRISVSAADYTSPSVDWRTLVIGCGSMSEPYKAYSAHDADGIKSIIVRNAQLETLPFATSYIPTNGAAATRAAEYCSIIASNNFTTPSLFVSCEASTFDSRASGSPVYSNTIISAESSSSDGRFYLSLRGSDKRSSFAVGSKGLLSVNHTGGVTTAGFSPNMTAIAGGNGDILSSAGGATPVYRSSAFIGYGQSGDRDAHIWGHIRNFRIWHRALTDAQIKGLK